VTQPPWNSGQSGPPGGDPWQRGYQLPAAGDPFAYGQQPAPQQPWPGYGQPPPAGGPPPHGRPPKRDNVQWIIATVAAVVVVTVVVGGLLWKLNSGNDTPRAATTTTSTSTTMSSPRTSTSTSSATPTAAPAPAPSTGSCNGHTAGPAAQTPAGWKTVVSPRGLAYDVPPDWKVNTCDTLVGWEKKCPETPDSPFGTCPIRTMSGSAELANPACPEKSSLAVSGAPGAKNTNDIHEAVNNETLTVKDIYTSDSGAVPNVDLSPPRDLTVAGAPAVEVIATVTGIAADTCTAPKALHVMVATTVAGQQGSVLFVISMAQDYQGAPDAGVADQMVGSLRLAS
jgi:hypothetical protein